MEPPTQTLPQLLCQHQTLPSRNISQSNYTRKSRLILCQLVELSAFRERKRSLRYLTSCIQVNRQWAEIGMRLMWSDVSIFNRAPFFKFFFSSMIRPAINVGDNVATYGCLVKNILLSFSFMEFVGPNPPEYISSDRCLALLNDIGNVAPRYFLNLRSLKMESLHHASLRSLFEGRHSLVALEATFDWGRPWTTYSHPS